MVIFRALGWILLFASLAVLVGDGVNALQGGDFRFVAAGELWYRLDAGSLNFLQAVTQRYLSAWLWDNVCVPVLLAPAFVVLMVPGLLLVIFARRKRRLKFF